MPKDYKDFFIKILAIINYTNDREAFADNFLITCEQRATTILIKHLPENVLETLTPQTTPEEIKNLIQKNFTNQQIDEIFRITLEKTFSGYIQNILPTLKESQKQDLNKLFSSIQTTTS